MQTSSTNRLAVHFRTNEFLEEVVKKLATKPVDWRALVESFKTLRGKHRTDLEYRQLHGIFLEIYTSLVILEVAQERNEKVFFYPIIDGEKTTRFQFFKARGDLEFNIRARRIKGGKTVGEYDIVILLVLSDTVGNKQFFPIIIEAKMFDPSEDKSTTANQLEESFSIYKINQRFEPLVEVFKTQDFGYLLVTASDNIIVGPNYQENFSDHGGRHAPIQPTYSEFTSQVKKQRIF